MEKTKQLLNHTSQRSLHAALRFVEFLGGAAILCYATLRALVQRPFYFRLFLEQCYQLGFKSLSLTTVTALSTGMVMTLQFGLGLERFGGKLYVPKIVGLSILRELGPVLTCLMLAGRVGSGIAAELGSMKVTQQIDAIRALGTDPIKRIVIPRVLAMFILAPMLTLFANIVGIFGGMLIAHVELNVPPSFYFHEALVGLRMIDFLVGISKTFVFGLIIGFTGCYFGLDTSGGTQGVGMSTTRAVVTSSSLVVIFDFILTKVWWLYERGLQ
jgi:phospholipid/cholesterol/gamma-HCH transport system permease protein